MYDTRIQSAVALETAVREHLEHLAVLAEDVGLEFRDTVRIGDATQMFEQQRADAVALEAIENRKRDLGATGIGASDITADADEALAPVLSQRRGQANVILEIELSQLLQILLRQVAPYPHETKIDGLFAHALEMIVQSLLVVGTNRANPDRGAIERHGVHAIGPRVDQHVAIFHTGRRV